MKYKGEGNSGFDACLLGMPNEIRTARVSIYIRFFEAAQAFYLLKSDEVKTFFEIFFAV